MSGRGERKLIELIRLSKRSKLGKFLQAERQAMYRNVHQAGKYLQVTLLTCWCSKMCNLGLCIWETGEL